MKVKHTGAGWKKINIGAAGDESLRRGGVARVASVARAFSPERAVLFRIFVALRVPRASEVGLGSGSGVGGCLTWSLALAASSKSKASATVSGAITLGGPGARRSTKPRCSASSSSNLAMRSLRGISSISESLSRAGVAVMTSPPPAYPPDRKRVTARTSARRRLRFSPFSQAPQPRQCVSAPSRAESDCGFSAPVLSPAPLGIRATRRGPVVRERDRARPSGSAPRTAPRIPSPTLAENNVAELTGLPVNDPSRSEVFCAASWKNRQRPVASHRYVNYLDVNT